MFHIGIIGCGRIAQWRHIPEYAANDQVRLTAFYDLDWSRADALARQYGGRAYRRVEELLADPDVDAVSVCTANNAHASLSVAALRAGKHVLCEKPMATTMEDCMAMVRVAENSGKVLMIGHNQRLDPAHVLAHDLIAQGTIGKILTFRACFAHGGPEPGAVDPAGFFDRRRAAMGVMADLGIHKTDLIHFLTGQRVVRTTARAVTLDKRDAAGNLVGVDDNTICIFELSGGAIGSVTASWTNYGPEENTTELYGTLGRLRLYMDPDYPLELSLRTGETRRYSADEIWNGRPRNSTGVIDAFVRSMAEGTRPPVTARSALESMRAVFASMESARTGRGVEIPENW